MNQIEKRAKWDKWAGYALGIGIVLFLVHTPWQPGMTYNPDDQTYSGVFLPALGIALVIGTAFAVLIRDGEKHVFDNAGPKWAWIPMLVIVGSMFARLAVDPSMKTLSSAMFGVVLFAVYLAARKLGASIFKPVAVAVVIEALSCVVIGVFVEPGIRTGGIISFPARNYAIATGLLILGATLAIGKWRWLVVSIALVGLLFVGSGEAILVVSVIVVVALIRKDWGRKLLPVGAVAIIAVVLLPMTAPGKDLYHPVADKIRTMLRGDVVGEVVVPVAPDTNSVSYPRDVAVVTETATYSVHYDYEWEATLDNALSWRWTGWKQAVQKIAPLGHGFELTSFNFYTVHNVPLIVADQIGPLAALAWLFLMVVGLVKTKWKYTFAALLALSILDHLTWTMFAPLWPAILGIASTSNIEDDLIFRRLA